MKIQFDNVPSLQPRVLMRKAGYGEKVTKQGKVSYIRRLRAAEFPRFHAYVDTKAKGFQVNLHLDQKGACYTGTSSHSGEYEGDVVDEEAKRMKETINHLLLPPDHLPPTPPNSTGSTFHSGMTFG